VKLKIEIDSKSYLVEVEVAEEDFAPKGPRAPSLLPQRAAMPAALPPPAAQQPQESVANESKVCRSPIVGLVTKVLVAAGAKLKANEPLLVLEAMKMESHITAPFDGTVLKIDVKPGEPVQSGQVLVEFE
jgi:methylmalonyl-CoA carboxyltransferase small subunit